MSPSPPPPGPLNTYFGNLHSHTPYSDGPGTPAEAYARARDAARPHLLALAGHNHAEALGDDRLGIGNSPSLCNGPESLISTADALTRGGQFTALYGREFSTISTGNHPNVFDAGEATSVAKGASICSSISSPPARARPDGRRS